PQEITFSSTNWEIDPKHLQIAFDIKDCQSKVFSKLIEGGKKEVTITLKILNGAEWAKEEGNQISFRSDEVKIAFKEKTSLIPVKHFAGTDEEGKSTYRNEYIEAEASFSNSLSSEDRVGCRIEPTTIKTADGVPLLELKDIDNLLNDEVEIKLATINDKEGEGGEEHPYALANQAGRILKRIEKKSIPETLQARVDHLQAEREKLEKELTATYFLQINTTLNTAQRIKLYGDEVYLKLDLENPIELDGQAVEFLLVKGGEEADKFTNFAKNRNLLKLTAQKGVETITVRRDKEQAELTGNKVELKITPIGETNLPPLETITFRFYQKAKIKVGDRA
ncbi:4234_t:CDS:2, partial [Ambispora leptoticha]